MVSVVCQGCGVCRGVGRGNPGVGVEQLPRQGTGMAVDLDGEPVDPKDAVQPGESAI